MRDDDDDDDDGGDNDNDNNNNNSNSNDNENNTTDQHDAFLEAWTAWLGDEIAYIKHKMLRRCRGLASDWFALCVNHTHPAPILQLVRINSKSCET